MNVCSRNFKLFAFLLFCTFSHYANGDDKDTAMEMLKKYNYFGVNNPDPAMRNDEMFTEALMNFQNFVGMNETGELDNGTMTKLMSKRCGMPDIIDKGSMMRKRRKRYALSGAKWVGTIGYNFKSYSQTSQLSPDAIRGEVKRALNEWSKYADLTFKESKETSDIEISFERLEHGDNNLFDGPGMTLAHAFFPSRARIGGDLHFDDDEKWSIRSSKGVDIFHVSVHELGHSLGLQHSSVLDAIMFPYYPGYNPNLALTEDDIKGIQALYGARRKGAIASTTPMPTPPTDTAGTLRNQFCLSGTVDATGTLNEVIFVFQGELYAELDSSGIRPGYPRLIRDEWPGLPDNLDAALSLDIRNNVMLLLFKDTNYWRYAWGNNNKPQLVEGYPRSISSDFTGPLPTTVDAAYTWSDNGRVFIVKDGMYYRARNNIKVLPNKLNVRCDRWYYGYPKNFAKNWNIDGEVSDVLMYHGRTFFFTGQTYLRYNDNKYEPDTGYPLRTSESWFGCKASGSLVDPGMEMDFMEAETQFEEIQATGDNTIAAATTCHSGLSHIVSLVTVTLLAMIIVRG